MANHVSHAALPYPIKGARFTVLVPYLDADGDPIDPTTPDTERSIDGAAFADCTEEVTTITGTNGMGYITLTGDETNCSLLAVAAKVASGPKNTLLMAHPRILPTLESGTAQSGAATNIRLTAGAAAYDLTGCIVQTTGGTGGAGGSGSANNQARIITVYDSTLKDATVSPAWEVTPDATTTYKVMLTETAVNSVAGRFVRPTTDGRTLDITTTGGAGIDWANVESQSTSVNLSATTVNLVNTLTTYTGNTLQTGDSFARLGAPAGASVSADIAAIEAQTDDIGAAGAGLTAIPWNATWDAEVQSECNDALVAIFLDRLFAVDYDPSAKPGVGTALLNEIIGSDAGVSQFTANALELAPGGAGANPNMLLDTTIAVVNSQTSFTLTAGSNDDDAYLDQAIVLYDVSDSSYPSIRKITDYVASTRTVTIDSAPVFTIVAGDGTKIFVTAPGTTAPTAAQNAAAVWDENIVSGHSTADTSGLILSQLTKRSVTFSTAVVAGSVFRQIADDGTATYDRTTDSLQALKDVGNPVTSFVANSITAAALATDAGTEIATAVWANATRTLSSLGFIYVAGDFGAGSLNGKGDWLLSSSTGTGFTAIPWNSAWDTEIQSECDDALVARKLDRLLNTAVVGADVTDNSVIAKLVSSSGTADWDTFNNTLHSLQGLYLVASDILLDTVVIGAAGIGLTAIPWNAVWDAEVESEVTDALVSVTYAEPGSGTPAATASLKDKINYLYKGWRNRYTQTTSQFSLYNDDGTTIGQKAPASDSAGTLDRGELITGP